MKFHCLAYVKHSNLKLVFWISFLIERAFLKESRLCEVIINFTLVTFLHEYRENRTISLKMIRMYDKKTAQGHQ